MCAYYSKACRLSETIQTEIQQGRLFNNPYFPSEIQLAARYCASRHTVRRILAKLTDDGILIRMDNGRVKISPSVEENISINPGKIKLAWIYAAYPDSTIAEVTAGIVDFAEKNEVDLQIINSTSGHQEVLQLLPHIKQLGFDGAMILSYEIPEYAACLNQLVREHFPVVTFGPTYGSNCSSVSTDDFGSTFQAVRDLIQRYDRPVYFIGACESGSATERYHAYCRAMLDAGFEQEIRQYSIFLECACPNPDYWPIEQKLLHPAELIRKAVEQLPRPCSIFCVNDYVANGVYRSVEKDRIGIDLMVVGFDDLPLARRLCPPLSTIQVDKHQIGFQMAMLLHKIISQRIENQIHLKLPATFIRRKSS